ncbi:MAG: alpha/beta fold hydrolase [Microthrixaceae bacterium]
MTTFALVHGAWHTGACWDPTAELLRAAGHTVIAPDLPCTDPTAGLADYTATVLEALDPHQGDDIVVVGHSLGGLTIPLVAAARPVRALVFVCAFVPLPGATLTDDLFTLEDTFPPEWAELASHQIRHDDGASSWPIQPAIDAFYHDCPDSLATWAAGTLRRQAWSVASEPCPLRAYPDVAAHAIVCADDRVLSAESCARHASERMGATVTRLGGGHSPMLAQPAALTDALLAS